MAVTSVSTFRNYRKILSFALAGLLICWLATNGFAQEAELHAYQAVDAHPFSDATIALSGAPRSLLLRTKPSSRSMPWASTQMPCTRYGQ